MLFLPYFFPSFHSFTQLENKIPLFDVNVPVSSVKFLKNKIHDFRKVIFIIKDKMRKIL